jgi:Putative adhesin
MKGTVRAMKRELYRALAFSLFSCLVLSVQASAQDFQQSYRIAPGGSVKVANISGNVTVAGYEGDTIMVTGYKEGPDSEKVTFEDLSGGNKVDVRVKYPENCDCRVDVRFEVKVPSGINYRFDSFSSVSGNVEVSNVTGVLRANSVSGNVKVNGVAGSVKANSVSGNVHVGAVKGEASANSVSGDVEVAINSLEGTESMEFASVSGNVSVKLPGNLDAEVKLSTMSGELKTDFPLQVEEVRNGRSAKGRVGNGSRSLKLSAVSGSVSLLRN